jgi:hypothetical protein
MTATPRTGSTAPSRAPVASPRQSKLEAPADSRRARTVRDFAQQPVTARVLPDAVERERRHVESDAVEDDGGSLAVSRAQRLRKDGGGEGKERHDHQQQGVQDQNDPVGYANVVEHDVVI